MSEATFHAPFNIGAYVLIDGDREIPAVVIGVLFRPHNVEFELAWLHNGQQHTAWIAAFRLSPGPAKREAPL